MSKRNICFDRSECVTPVLLIDILSFYENIWNLLLYCKNQSLHLALYAHRILILFFCRSSSDSLQWASEVTAGSLLSDAAGWPRQGLPSFPAGGTPL